MVPIEQLLPGTRVKIVDQWVSGCNQNSDGYMDQYLGRVVTVLKRSVTSRYCVLIEEDKGDVHGPWYWNKYCFDYIVEDEYEDFEPASNSEIFSFIIGK